MAGVYPGGQGMKRVKIAHACVPLCPFIFQGAQTVRRVRPDCRVQFVL